MGASLRPSTRRGKPRRSPRCCTAASECGAVCVAVATRLRPIVFIWCPPPVLCFAAPRAAATGCSPSLGAPQRGEKVTRVHTLAQAEDVDLRLGVDSRPGGYMDDLADRISKLRTLTPREL